MDTTIKQLINDNYTFIVNHSGGKDSQAMYLFLKQFIPDDQLIVIHATLGEIEWPGTIEHIKRTITHDLMIAKPVKTFFDMVDKRRMFPSPKYRQCTSDLKRGPIDREIRRYLKKLNKKNVVSCMGIRAQESAARSKKKEFKFDTLNSKARRSWYSWLPIFNWSTDEVFDYIKRHNQKPHWAYSKGMSRLSCSFCIMASKKDLRIASELRPILFDKYVKKEKELGVSMMMPIDGKPIFLEEYISK